MSEWLEFQGYFVRRNIKVGKRPRGGYECELDIVALHPTQGKLVQYEPSTDTHSWAIRERRYRKKFDAGRKHIPNLFSGMSIPAQMDQVALFLYGSKTNHSFVGGGRVMMAGDLLGEIVVALKTKRIAKAMIPEQYPLLRMVQLTCEYRHTLLARDG